MSITQHHAGRPGRGAVFFGLLVAALVAGSLATAPARAAFSRTALIDRQIREAQQKAEQFAKQMSELKTKAQQAKAERDQAEKEYRKVLDEQRRLTREITTTGNQLQSELKARLAEFEASEAMQKHLERQKAWEEKMKQAEARVLGPLYRQPDFQELCSRLEQARREAAQLEAQPIKSQEKLVALHDRIIQLDRQVNQRRNQALEKDPEYLLAKQNYELVTADIANARKKFEQQVRNSNPLMQIQVRLDQLNDQLRTVSTEQLAPAQQKFQQTDRQFRQTAAQFNYASQMHAKYTADVKRLQRNRQYIINRSRRRR